VSASAPPSSTLAAHEATDARVLKILTAAPVNAGIARIAAPRCATKAGRSRDTYKNGNPKVSYLPPRSPSEGRWFLDGTDVAGRFPVLLALARHPDHDAQTPLPDALRGLRSPTPAPCGECAGDEILVEHLPADVAEPIKRALEQRLADRVTEDGAA
jgi:hypothetical protein